MGRIKAKFLKSITRELLEKNPEQYDSDFEKDKQVVSSKINVSSKKLRNIIAGYAARLKKAGKY